MRASVAREFRGKSARVWKAIMEHPFVRGIGSGGLPRDRYAYYLAQDYVYLVEFGRALAMASAKSEELSDMTCFARLLNATLETEMDLHRRTCAEFGISAGALERTEPSLVTTAYANLLVRSCYEGRIADIFAALLPCEAGYVEIAETLKKARLPANPHYREWIEMYSSPQFREFAEWVTARFDGLAASAPGPEIERWYRLYLTSARFELLFFEMSWTQESWPVIVPV